MGWIESNRLEKFEPMSGQVFVHVDKTGFQLQEVRGVFGCFTFPFLLIFAGLELFQSYSVILWFASSDKNQTLSYDMAKTSFMLHMLWHGICISFLSFFPKAVLATAQPLILNCMHLTKRWKKTEYIDMDKSWSKYIDTIPSYLAQNIIAWLPAFLLHFLFRPVCQCGGKVQATQFAESLNSSEPIELENKPVPLVISEDRKEPKTTQNPRNLAEIVLEMHDNIADMSQRSEAGSRFESRRKIPRFSRVLGWFITLFKPITCFIVTVFVVIETHRGGFAHISDPIEALLLGSHSLALIVFMMIAFADHASKTTK